jgi:hypothetical protein
MPTPIEAPIVVTLVIAPAHMRSRALVEPAGQ